MKLWDEIINLITETCYVTAPIESTSNLYSDLQLDSLTLINILLRIEDMYSITFDIFEIEACLQLDCLVATVEKKIKESAYDTTSIS